MKKELEELIRALPDFYEDMLYGFDEEPAATQLIEYMKKTPGLTTSDVLHVHSRLAGYVDENGKPTQTIIIDDD